jgi:hypothetical protein
MNPATASILGATAMSLGFNSNVQVGSAVYHVQTEDCGLNHPFVDTVVLCGGQVLHRRSASYRDLLGGPALDETALRTRIEQQHREVLEALRAGSLRLEEDRQAAIIVKLCNPASWLVAGQATLEVEVLSRTRGEPVAGASVSVSIEGADGAKPECAAQTGADGRAWLRFPMPSVTQQAVAALVIRARGAHAQDQVRYRLKPRTRKAAPPL